MGKIIFSLVLVTLLISPVYAQIPPVNLTPQAKAVLVAELKNKLNELLNQLILLLTAQLSQQQQANQQLQQLVTNTNQQNQNLAQIASTTAQQNQNLAQIASTTAYQNQQLGQIIQNTTPPPLPPPPLPPPPPPQLITTATDGGYNDRAYGPRLHCFYSRNIGASVAGGVLGSLKFDQFTDGSKLKEIVFTANVSNPTMVTNFSAGGILYAGHLANLTLPNGQSRINMAGTFTSQIQDKMIVFDVKKGKV